MLLLHPELPPEQLVRALALARRSGADWMPVLVEHAADGAFSLIPVSLGWSTAPAALARWADGDSAAELLELRHVLAHVARARHDLNNPLTSAMAETQLALMDVEQPDIRAGLETIQEQLRRIRDLVGGLRVLRPPS